MNEYTAADVNEIQPVTTKAVGEVDALYVPTDNLFAIVGTQISSMLQPLSLIHI